MTTYHTDEIKSKKSRGKDKTKPAYVLDLKKWALGDLPDREQAHG